MARDPLDVLFETQQNAKSLVIGLDQEIALSFTWLDEQLVRATHLFQNEPTAKENEPPKSPKRRGRRGKVKEESENAISAAASVLPRDEVVASVLPRDEVQQSDDGALVEVLEPISVDCKLDRKSEEEPDPTLGSERSPLNRANEGNVASSPAVNDVGKPETESSHSTKPHCELSISPTQPRRQTRNKRIPARFRKSSTSPALKRSSSSVKEEHDSEIISKTGDDQSSTKSLEKSKTSGERMIKRESVFKKSNENQSRISSPRKVFKEPLANPPNESYKDLSKTKITTDSLTKPIEETVQKLDITVEKPLTKERKSRANQKMLLELDASSKNSSVTDITITLKNEKDEGTSSKVVERNVHSLDRLSVQPVKRDRKSRVRQTLKIECETTSKNSVLVDNPVLLDVNKRASRSMNLRKRLTEFRNIEVINTLLNSAEDKPRDERAVEETPQIFETTVSQPLKRERKSRANPLSKQVEKTSEKVNDTNSLKANDQFVAVLIQSISSQEDSISKRHSKVSGHLHEEVVESESSESETPQAKRSKVNHKSMHLHKRATELHSREVDNPSNNSTNDRLRDDKSSWISPSASVAQPHTNDRKSRAKPLSKHMVKMELETLSKKSAVNNLDVGPQLFKVSSPCNQLANSEMSRSHSGEKPTLEGVINESHHEKLVDSDPDHSETHTLQSKQSSVEQKALQSVFSLDVVPKRSTRSTFVLCKRPTELHNSDVINPLMKSKEILPKNTSASSQVFEENNQTANVICEKPMERESDGKQLEETNKDTSIKKSIVTENPTMFDDVHKRMSRSMNLRKRPTESRTCSVISTFHNSSEDIPTENTASSKVFEETVKTPEASNSQPAKRERKSRAKPLSMKIGNIELQVSSTKVTSNDISDADSQLDRGIIPSINQEEDPISRTQSMLTSNTSEEETIEFEGSESHTPQAKRSKVEYKTSHGYLRPPAAQLSFSGLRGSVLSSSHSGSSSGLHKFRSRILQNPSQPLRGTSPAESSQLNSKNSSSLALTKTFSSGSSGSSSLFQNKFRSRILQKPTIETESSANQSQGPHLSTIKRTNTNESSFLDVSSSQGLRSCFSKTVASPLINSSMERTTTGGRILNIQSFLPLRPVKHKPTKEEAQAKKEEELRLKKEKEESARLRKQERDRAEAEKKRLQREERERRVLEARMAKEQETKLTKELQEKKNKQEEEERRKRDEVMKKRKQDIEEKRQKEREELLKKKKRDAEIHQKRLEEEAQRRKEEEEEKRKREEDEEKRKKEEEKEKRKKEEEIRRRKEQEERNQNLEAEKKAKLEAARAALSSVKERSDSYEITPGRSELPPQKLKDPDNYDIGDLKSDQETDDEDCPKKTIPSWAKGPFFKSALLRQCYQPPDVDHIFAVPNPSIDLGEVFQAKQLRLYKRTSSAVWDHAPITHKYH